MARLGIGIGIRRRKGSLASYWNTRTPTDLAVIWEDDYAKLDWTIYGTKGSYEVWESVNGGDYALAATTSEGVDTYNFYTYQNASVNIKIRGVKHGYYSEFTDVVNISTPLVFRTDQSTLKNIVFGQFYVAAGKTVYINKGDGSALVEVVGSLANVTLTYSTEGQYYVTISGDINSITRLIHNPNNKSYGDLSKWKIDTIKGMQRFRLEESNFSGDVSDWVVVPACTYFYIFTNYFTGTLPVINGTTGSLRYYCNANYINDFAFTGFRTSMTHFYVYSSRSCVSPEKIDALLKDIADFYETNTPLTNCEFNLGGTNNGYPTGGNANVDKVRIETYFTNAGMTATITVNTVKRFDDGKIVFSWDDSQGNLYTYGMPIFVDKGISVTVFDNGVITGTQPSRLTPANKIEMYNAGMDMQCHSDANHVNLTTLSEVQLLANLQNVNDGFTTMGIPTPNHIAYPGGAYNDNVKLWCSAMRLTGSTSAGSPVVSQLTYPKDDKFVIKRIAIDNISEANLILLKALMDYAKCSKACIVLYGHGVLPNNDTYEIGESELIEIIDYANEVGLDIINYSELYPLLEP